MQEHNYNMNFQRDIRHSRRNLSNFCKDQQGVPFSAYDKFLNRYRHDLGFQRTVDAICMFTISMIFAIGGVTYAFYLYYNSLKP